MESRRSRRKTPVPEAPHSLNEVAPHFCRLAAEVISDWAFQKDLFEPDRGPNDPLRSAWFGHFFSRLNELLCDGWFLSVARLHDPAVSFKSTNISVDYITEHPDLDAKIKSELEPLRAKMNSFATKVKPPRHKLLAHNDARSIIAQQTIGEFTKGEDEDYIRNLKRFASIVSEEFCGGSPFVYDDLMGNDVDAVVSILRLGLKARSAKQ